jgi:hypothetical protein
VSIFVSKVTLLARKAIVLDRCWEGWHMPEIPALGRLKQEDCKFKDSLSHTVPGQPGLHSEMLSQNETDKHKDYFQIGHILKY